ncbi:MAG TPA: O-antigen ligase family protein [Rhizomicrobium sp.]|nr:O-antigen ligase family protein [Rhizomicrobium sp.]
MADNSMANNGLSFQTAQIPLRLSPWVIEGAFIVLLLLSFVGLTPFQIRDPQVLAMTNSAPSSGDGDMIRQIAFLSVLMVLSAGALQRRGLAIIRAVPVSMLLVLAWCAASALWAGEPGIAFRRAGLEIVVVTSLMLAVEALGTKRCLELLRYVMIGVLVVDWISIPLIPQARHLANETDPSIVGDWRGLYYQKNITGAVCALSILVFGYFALRDRRKLDYALLLATAIFLIMTNSKSSMGLLPASLLAAGLYVVATRTTLDRAIVLTGLALTFILAAAAIVVEWQTITHIFSDPDAFTGRVEIWHAELAHIADHPLLGAGFGTFADAGARSPLYPYVHDKWVGAVAHGHNGYLQLLVTIGGIGFVLAMAAFIANPVIGFWRGRKDLLLTAFLFSVFIFVLLHNLTETDFLEGAGPPWAMFVLMIAMLRARHEDREPEATSWPSR